MEESLSLFYTTIHSPLFAKSSIILFLNKMDILAEKIQFSDLKTYFPGFKGRLVHIQLKRKAALSLLSISLSYLIHSSFCFFCVLAPPSGKCQDVQDAMQFIEELYKQKAGSIENSKNIYSHFICAMEIINPRILFLDVEHTVLSQVLKKCKML